MIIQPSDRLKTVQEYYFSKKLAHLDALRKEGKDVINLGIGSPDMAPDESVVEALSVTAKVATNHGYQSYRGLQELRDAIAIWYLKTYKVKLDRTGEILPLMGSKEGIMHISMAFLNKRDQVLVPNPGYPTYASVSNLMQADMITYDLKEDNWYPDLEALEQMDLSKVKIMWINYPNMPTGQVGNDELFKSLITFAKKNELLLINDNPYSLVLNQAAPMSIFQFEGAKEVCLELNSLSKSHNMAGWRIGMLIGGSDYINTILKVKSNMDSGMFKGLQLAAIEALNLGQDYHDKINTIYKDRRNIVYQIFDAIDCNYSLDQEGMFVWAKLPSNIKDVEEYVEEILKKTFVFITPGFIFGSNGNRYLRISLCANTAIFEEALNRIKTKL